MTTTAGTATLENVVLFHFDRPFAGSGLVVPMAHAQGVLDCINRRIARAPLIGQVGYPGDPHDVLLTKATHAVTEARLEGSQLVGTVKILDTIPGRELQKLIEAEAYVAFRPSMSGNHDKERNEFAPKMVNGIHAITSSAEEPWGGQ